MRKLLTLLFMFSGLTVATVSHGAHGVADVTWGVTCTPIVTDVVPTAGPVSLMFSELGNDQTHNAYQVRFIVGSATANVPDAWRFDAAGCQGSAFITINHLPPATAAKTCPAFQGATASIQIKDFSFSPAEQGYATTLMRGVLANTYPAGNTSIPTTRYFLAQFIFDHTFSVAGATTPGADCGGFETPMCVAMLKNGPATTTYLRMSDGAEFPFEAGNHFVTVNGIAGCNAVPAQAKTWGQIKSQYRN